MYITIYEYPTVIKTIIFLILITGLYIETNLIFFLDKHI